MVQKEVEYFPELGGETPTTRGKFTFERDLEIVIALCVSTQFTTTIIQRNRNMIVSLSKDCSCLFEFSC